ncbi:hypothetical protein D2T29_22360 [Sinirhodobacter populi]|uniref:Uncharacterized protein n=1 Tax=Paenirhodobacter populi TaxID=2306993 RepID=A0A443JX77_9RHOB|nr:hypothetical protein [Sinirhodobacter populi]RWR25105.1 hypothetical protein D2T29_22360 [Sinirhodobacter populi]
MWEVLESGVSKGRNGLIITATTAGRWAEGFAADRYVYARDVALGKITDPSILPILFEMQEGDDWTDLALLQPRPAIRVPRPERPSEQGAPGAEHAVRCLWVHAISPEPLARKQPR